MVYNICIMNHVIKYYRWIQILMPRRTYTLHCSSRISIKPLYLMCILIETIKGHYNHITLWSC